MTDKKETWSVVYESAIRRDGTLFFPEKLSLEFLEKAKQTMGSFLFANQYLNQIVPEGSQPFKKEWFKYRLKPFQHFHTFAFIDPAISQESGADYTAVVIVQVDSDKYWHVRVANRYKITPSELMNLIFRMQKEWNCQTIGIEEVAFQKVLLYMLDEEMRRRGEIIPVAGVKTATDKSKEMRIMGLVPRFEWGRIFLQPGLNDLEMELAQFPRGGHDDLCDALAQMERIIFYPQPYVEPVKKVAPNHPEYEKYYIASLNKPKKRRPHV